VHKGITLPEVKCGNCGANLDLARIKHGGKYCCDSCRDAAKQKRRIATHERTTTSAVAATMNHPPIPIPRPMTAPASPVVSSPASHPVTDDENAGTSSGEVVVKSCPLCHRTIKPKQLSSLPYCSSECAERANVIAQIAQSLNPESKKYQAHQAALDELQAKYDRLWQDYELMRSQRDAAVRDAELASGFAMQLVHDSALPVPNEVIDFLQALHQPSDAEVAAWQ